MRQSNSKQSSGEFMVVKNAQITYFRNAALSLITEELRERAIIFLHELRTREHAAGFNFPLVDPSLPIESYTKPEEMASYYQMHFALNSFMELHSPRGKKVPGIIANAGVLLHQAYTQLPNAENKLHQYNGIMSQALMASDPNTEKLSRRFKGNPPLGNHR